MLAPHQANFFFYDSDAWLFLSDIQHLDQEAPGGKYMVEAPTQETACDQGQ
jgi:hypothetical protein